MAIYRKLQDVLIRKILANPPAGLVLSGIVSSGKTTLIQEALKSLAEKYQIFEYTGDDVQFRSQILANTRYFNEDIRSKTTKPALIFVDEVQKCEEIFDAIKYAFDHTKAAFIISGSNPAYLNSIAKKRLQRRADFLELQPFSLPEILLHEGFIRNKDMQLFQNLLFESLDPSEIKLEVDSVAYFEKIIDRYLTIGGLPLAHLASSQRDSLLEIRKVVERGFELMNTSNESLSEVVKVELALIHSREFTYKNIMNKTRIRRREVINKTIDELINHGYLVLKKPVLFEEDRKSYLTVYSYIDPGIVTYLSAQTDLAQIRGSRIEGIAHTQILSLLNQEPLKLELSYYKPHTKDAQGKIKYLPGEIDFVIKKANEYIPIEVKATNQISQINTQMMFQFLKLKRSRFGIILYGGLPYWDKGKEILFFPYWLV